MLHWPSRQTEPAPQVLQAAPPRPHEPDAHASGADEAAPAALSLNFFCAAVDSPAPARPAEARSRRATCFGWVPRWNARGPRVHSSSELEQAAEIIAGEYARVASLARSAALLSAADAEGAAVAEAAPSDEAEFCNSLSEIGREGARGLPTPATPQTPRGAQETSE